MPQSAASSVGGLVEWGSGVLVAASATPRLDSELLLSHVVDRPRSAIVAFPENAVSAAREKRFRDLINERGQGVPLAYLTGTREFYSLELEVTRETLVPRPETELLVELSLQLLSEQSSADVLELGTGSGAIALALKSERPDLNLTALDVSPAALAVAQRNAERLALDVRWLLSSWFEALGSESFDLIVSNPPYVATADPHFAGDLRHEPRAALAAGSDGLTAIREILESAGRYLRSGGSILLEHGFDQGEAVAAIAREHGFREIETSQDLSGHYRVTMARAPR
ncbi:MAG: peptide chain release factor N(5)-glutamine methyltransferase [Candidatus Rariloculaceae bacterium]